MAFEKVHRWGGCGQQIFSDVDAFAITTYDSFILQESRKYVLNDSGMLRVWSTFQTSVADVVAPLPACRHPPQCPGLLMRVRVFNPVVPSAVNLLNAGGTFFPVAHWAEPAGLGAACYGGHAPIGGGPAIECTWCWSGQSGYCMFALLGGHGSHADRMPHTSVLSVIVEGGGASEQCRWALPWGMLITARYNLCHARRKRVIPCIASAVCVVQRENNTIGAVLLSSKFDIW